MACLLMLLLSAAVCSVQAQRFGGINMTRFCMAPGRQRLLMCKRHLVPTPSPPSPCANLSVGEEVNVAYRGRGRYACTTLHSPDVIGICQTPYSGHDNYMNCQSGQQTRPSFCGTRALWFVRCDALIEQHTTVMYTTTSRPADLYVSHTTMKHMPPFQMQTMGPRPGFFTPPTTTMFDHSSSCGCSWSSQHGCVVSSRQMINALANPSVVQKACIGNSSSLECGVRRLLVSKAAEFRKCLDLPASMCNSASNRNFCQWAAQGSGECGIDEEGLMLQLVGEQYSQHPLVKLIMLKKKCNKFTEYTCEATYSDCAWMPSHPQAMCDVKPSKVVGMMFSLPSLVPALQRSVEEARCRTSKEAGSSCPSPMCVMLHGVCQHNPDGGALHSVDGMVSALCESSWQTARVCPKPCLSIAGRCESPKTSIESAPLNHDSEHVVRVMAVLMSSVWPFEQQCFKGNGGLPGMCKASSPACRPEHFPTPGDILPHHETAMGPGLKGVLKELSSAIGSDRAGQFLHDHIENNPEGLEELTKTAYESLSSFFKPASTTAAPWSEVPSTPATTSATPFFSTSAPPASGLTGLGPEQQRNLWAIAGGAVLIAAVCAGVGMGVVCHARMARSQVREPLLAGSAMNSEVNEPSRDRELEPMPAAP